MAVFRSDLYYRIGVIEVPVAPLRERRDDIPLLALRFFDDLTGHADRRLEGFTPAALEALTTFDWPGNVRQLRNVVEHAVVLGEGPTITRAGLPTSVVPPTSGAAAPDDDPTLVRLPSSLAELERRAIDAALHATGGHNAKTAELLGSTG